MKIILASSSPRRREILEQVGIAFEIMASNKEEIITSTDPAQVVEELSHMKAEDIVEQAEEDCLVIGADTVVSSDHRILGKPKDADDAFRMLKNLSGRAHAVYTGVTLIKRMGLQRQIETFHVETKVYVADMTDDEIWAYIETKEPMDKAGAYGIQGKFAAYITALEGDYYNVVGLPVASIYQKLKEMDAISR